MIFFNCLNSNYLQFTSLRDQKVNNDMLIPYAKRINCFKQAIISLKLYLPGPDFVYIKIDMG